METRQGRGVVTSLMVGRLEGIEQDLVHAFDGAMVLPAALLVAAAVGAAHGLAPGHGKTMAVAYLVGSQASRRHATALAIIVAAMHTASVLALGLFWWMTVSAGTVPIDAVTRWAQLAAALCVFAVGAAITRRRWRQRGSPHHHHAPPTAAPWSRAGLIGIAAAGGLQPSPSAFIVLVSGLLTGRVGLALGMVGMFGVGLAATVLATGLLTIKGRDWISRRVSSSRRPALFMQQLPLLGASAVLVGGCLLVVLAVNELVAT